MQIPLLQVTICSKRVPGCELGLLSPSSGGVQLEDLQSILRNMGGAPTPANPVDLSEAMKADDIIPMLANEQIRWILYLLNILY